MFPASAIKGESRFKAAPVAGLPRCCGGLVGYFGYDTVRYVEKRLASAKKKDELGTPDILLLVSEEIAIVDNLSGKLTLVVYAEPSSAEELPPLAPQQPAMFGSPSTPASLPPPPPPEPGMPASAPLAVILMLEQWW